MLSCYAVIASPTNGEISAPITFDVSMDLQLLKFVYRHVVVGISGRRNHAGYNRHVDMTRCLGRIVGSGENVTPVTVTFRFLPHGVCEHADAKCEAEAGAEEV